MCIRARRESSHEGLSRSRHKTKKKVKVNVSPWLETVPAITANAGEIITSSGFSLRIRITVIYV